ncbi:unnamed protein product [Brassicogethes aeneus]|uniref:Kinase suppressor of Ras 2 n=1 Tax=Brassicogethes aeneus TaxID=1431903 RepID=A0A9P0FR92_BRAAE|nr:unnamed protein product [Brassicogethes aeneus]
MADDTAEQELKKNLLIVQSMIDVSADRLVGLRTQCATSAELTQQEIRTLEGKLLKLFSDQIVTKSKLKNGSDPHMPSLTQWLQVVGLSKDSIQGICRKISSVEELQEKSEHDLKTILNQQRAKPEELSRLCRALHNLKRYTDVLRKGGNEPTEMNLFWDSWDRSHPLRSGLSPRTGRSRADRASVPGEESLLCNNNNHHHHPHPHQQQHHHQVHHGHHSGSGGASIPPSTSVSSINSLNVQCSTLLGQPQAPPGPPLTPPGYTKGKGMKFPTTPPAKKKHLTGNLLTDMYPLTKSKSHESELAASKENGEISTNGTGRRGRLPTEPGPETQAGYGSPILTSPIKSPPYSNSGGTDSDDNSTKSITLPVPKSPRTPAPPVMTHHINHRFNKRFEVKNKCAFCLKPIYFMTSLKCIECKYTCHRQCEEQVPASCGLPPEYLIAFKNQMTDGVISPPRPQKSFRKPSHPQPSINLPPFQYNPDSSSNTSSCNSSTPSSPALQTLTTPHSYHKQSFHFPDVPKINEDNGDLSSVSLELTSSRQQPPLVVIDTARTASLSSKNSNSTDSDRTPVRVDSQDSQVSDTDTITDEHRWPRQNSLSMREWDIPFHEVQLGSELGTGRFGTVYQGKWHGDVAVKILNVNYLKDEKTLEQFKMEVATFRKTRHENLILFMGACMKPPQLAIVTSLSKGNTLYTHIHLRKDKFNMNKTTIVAQQISQGMGYLHAKGIVHKDLKSKNIFLENGKVVITDFGLFSVTKLCFGNRKSDSLNIPPGWLCYLAPEIMRSLHAHQAHDEELPFSTASDVYAFGTVWYELLCGEWPFKGQPPEAVIWQVGKGMKQPLANLQASRDVKDILLACWKLDPKDRKDFVDLQTILEKFPKKRLARSPSHPIHLSRSAESVF